MERALSTEQLIDELKKFHLEMERVSPFIRPNIRKSFAEVMENPVHWEKSRNVPFAWDLNYFVDDGGGFLSPVEPICTTFTLREIYGCIKTILLRAEKLISQLQKYPSYIALFVTGYAIYSFHVDMQLCGIISRLEEDVMPSEEVQSAEIEITSLIDEFLPEKRELFEKEMIGLNNRALNLFAER